MPTPALRVVFNRQTLALATRSESTDRYGKPCLLTTTPVCDGVVHEQKSRYGGGGRLVCTATGRTLAKALNCGSVSTKTNHWFHAAFAVSHKARFETHGVPFVEVANKLEPCPEPV